MDWNSSANIFLTFLSFRPNYTMIILERTIVFLHFYLNLHFI